MTGAGVDPIDDLLSRADDVIEFVAHRSSEEDRAASRGRRSVAEWISLVGRCLGHVCGPEGTIEPDTARAASWLAWASALSVRAEVELAPTDSLIVLRQDAVLALRLRVIGALGFDVDVNPATQLVGLYRDLGEIAGLAESAVRREANPLIPRSPLAGSLWSMFAQLSYGSPDVVDPLAEVRQGFAAFAARSAALAAALHPGGPVDAPQR